MFTRKWEEKREYYNTENGLIKSQHGFKEVRLFGILISKKRVAFDSECIDKKGSLGFNNK